MEGPIGYVNVHAKEGANIIPDEQRAPLIRRAFELMATGKHKKWEVLKIVNDEGLTAVSGKPVTNQTFHNMLRNPIYTGWVSLSSDTTLAPVRGLHEPIVSQELFDRVQAVLDGKKPPAPARRKVNPEFPLRRLVRCRACGIPLTGAHCKGTKQFICPLLVSPTRLPCSLVTQRSIGVGISEIPRVPTGEQGQNSRLPEDRGKGLGGEARKRSTGVQKAHDTVGGTEEAQEQSAQSSNGR